MRRDSPRRKRRLEKCNVLGAKLKNGDRFTGFEALFHSRKNARVGAEAIIDSYQKTLDKQLHFHTNLSF
jgi:hypothetical protein